MRRLLDRVSRLAAAHARWLAPCALFALLGFAILCGALGADFGEHWDEHYHLEGVRECVDGLVLAPRRYIYGSVYFLLGIAVLLAHNGWFLPAFFREVGRRQGGDIVDLDRYASVQRFQVEARAYLQSKAYLLETRMVFFCISSLSAVWIYLALRRLEPNRRLGALAGAAFAALSWELHYHGRFIAVDAMMAQLAALQLYLLIVAGSAPAGRPILPSILSAAIVAGVAFACKATGLAFAVPVVLLPFTRRLRSPSLGDRFGLAGLAALVFAVTAVALQPGTVFDLFRYVTTLRREAWEYGLGHSLHSNTTAGVVDRMASFLAWLWLAVPSPYPVAAAGLSAVTLLGLARFARDRPRLAIVGGSLAAVLLLTMATHPLLIVRQYLPLVPFLAVGFGLGVSGLQVHLRDRPLVLHGILLAMAVAFALNARWLASTALSVRTAGMDRTLDRLTADLFAHRQAVRLSPGVYAEIGDRLLDYRCRAPNGSTDAEPGAPLAIRSDERIWRANQLGLTRRTYGARWVNFDWYTPWVSRPESPPIFLLSAEGARRQHIHLEEHVLCTPVATGASAER
jgi:hypothetical protein